MFDCAVADVLPTLEERWPAMRDYMRSVGARKGIHAEWRAKSEVERGPSFGDEIEVFALRRSARLPCEKYPVVRRTNSVPHTCV